MTIKKYYEADRIIRAINFRKEIYETIENRFKRLNKDSSEEEMFEFFSYLIKNGFSTEIRDAIFAIRDSQEEIIKRLENKLEAL